MLHTQVSVLPLCFAIAVQSGYRASCRSARDASNVLLSGSSGRQKTSNRIPAGTGRFVTFARVGCTAASVSPRPACRCRAGGDRGLALSLHVRPGQRVLVARSPRLCAYSSEFVPELPLLTRYFSCYTRLVYQLTAGCTSRFDCLHIQCGFAVLGLQFVTCASDRVLKCCLVLSHASKCSAFRAACTALSTHWPRFVHCWRVVLDRGGELVWFIWQSLLSVVHQAVCSTDFRAIFALFLASSARAALLARPDELAEHV